MTAPTDHDGRARPDRPTTRGVRAPRGRLLTELHDEIERRHPIDVVAALSVLLLLVLLIPSPLIVKPLGAAGTPANLFAFGLLLWWGLAKVGAGLGSHRGRQPLRIALFVVLVTLAASLTSLAARASTPAEKTGAVRGLLAFAALAGVALVAADGITSVERVLVLLRRVVAGVAVVAVIGIVEFATGFNAGQALAIPGLTRNLDLPDQGRLLFLRVQSTAVHPIELGTVLGFTLPLAVQLALIAPRGRRFRSWVPVVLIATVLPMTLSRTGVIAASIGMISIGWYWSWRRRATAAAVLLGFVAVFRVFLPTMIDAVTTMFLGVSEDESTTARTGRYDVAAHYLLEHPLVGRGLSTLHPATNQIFDNQYLYAATETGILGVAAILGLFLTVWTMARVVRRRTTDDRVRAVTPALIGVAVAMPIVYATADMASCPMAMTLYFLVAGVIGALWRLSVAGSAPVPSPPVARTA